MDFVMRTGWMIALTVLIGMFSHDAMAGYRSLRCDRKLVKVGDFQSEVIAKCGDPQHVETFEDYPGVWVSKYYEDRNGRIKAPYLLRKPINKEVWTYQLGPNRLPYYLYFYQSRLTRIRTGSRH